LSDPDYPAWLDLVWVSVDARGRLGAFATGGQGPIAVSAFLASEQVGDWLDSLPDRSATKHGAAEAFSIYARKGLFAFDWSDVHRTSDWLDAYELMAAPMEPLLIDQIPVTVAKFIARTTLDIDLEQCPTLDPRQFISCHVAN